MQTKKRAKPVKFGKSVKETTQSASKEAAEAKNEATKAKSHEAENDDVKELAEADINSSETKEIKRIVEEKIHQKEEEALEKDSSESDEPLEIRLSEELPETPQEVSPSEPGLIEEPLQEDKPEEEKPSDLKEEKPSEEAEKPALYGSFTNDEGDRKPKKNSFGFFFLVAFITFIVGLAFIAGISYTMSLVGKKPLAIPAIQQSAPTPTSEPIVTPTPEEVDLSAYSIRILNGSGISGEAATARTLLTDKGFDVSTIGNAATSDYTKTVITAKKVVNESYLNELIKVLQDTYSVNSVVEDAPSSQTADVVITVGSDSAE